MEQVTKNVPMTIPLNGYGTFSISRRCQEWNLKKHTAYLSRIILIAERVKEKAAWRGDTVMVKLFSCKMYGTRTGQTSSFFIRNTK
jgi:hypothetical protein